mgnify:CR=1 FL=1
MTLQEAKLAHSIAQADMSQAKANGDAEAHAEAKVRYNAAAAAIMQATAQNSEENKDKKELAELKQGKATLKENFDKLWQEHIDVQNKLDDALSELRQLKAKYEPSPTTMTGPAAYTYGPKPQPAVKPGPIDFSDMFPDWDDTR